MGVCGTKQATGHQTAVQTAVQTIEPEECIICFEMIRNKISPRCCGKVFCTDCWRVAVTYKQLNDPVRARCPHCRHPKSDEARDEKLKEDIADVMMRVLQDRGEPAYIRSADVIIDS